MVCERPAHLKPPLALVAPADILANVDVALAGKLRALAKNEARSVPSTP